MQGSASYSTYSGVNIFTMQKKVCHEIFLPSSWFIEGFQLAYGLCKNTKFTLHKHTPLLYFNIQNENPVNDRHK